MWMWLWIALTVIIGYLLGNANGAVVLSRLMGDDVRNHGSGNAGLTNFVRNYGSGKAPLVFLIDGGKAVLGCLVGGLLLMHHLGYRNGAALGGAAVMLGHVFPALLKFKGGKGILSGIFIALMVDIRVGLMGMGVFALFYLSTLYVSLSSVLLCITYAVGFALMHYESPLVVGCWIFMSALAIFMHRQNMVRLVKGQERKTNLFQK